MAERYRYTECGLDYVYLANGFEVRDTPRGRAVSFTDLDGLHRTIGHVIVTERRRLSGAEIRFLRHELGLSQAELGRMLDVAERTVARWEKGRIVPPLTAEATLRGLYRERMEGRAEVAQSLDLMRATGLEDIARLDLVEDHGWDRAA